MSSEKKIAANQANSQASTGPKTESGKKASSLNATQHGFTGHTLVLTEAERPLYEAFSAQVKTEIPTTTAQTADLLQNHIDLRWSIQQITLQQNSLMSQISEATERLIAASDKAPINIEIELYYKRLKTLGTYESRRRKAATATLEQLNQLETTRQQEQQRELARASAVHKYFKDNNLPHTAHDLGFDHSTEEMEDFLNRRDNEIFINGLLNPAQTKPMTPAEQLLAQLAAENPTEEAA